MPDFDIRPANANDIPSLVAIDHSVSSDYVWQLDVRTEANQVTSSFREVRLPRSITVTYPRNPSALMDKWSTYDVVLAALKGGIPIGYVCAMEEHALSSARITDIVISTAMRRQGAASALLTAVHAWALERDAHRILLEMPSKNHPCIRFAQKIGYEFCGYNDQYYTTQDVALFFGRALK